jgi:hypothetical protein
MPDVEDIANELRAQIPKAGPQPNSLALDGKNPTITLAGQEWPIPLLAPRQNRVVVPAVSKVTKRMRDIAAKALDELSDATREQIVKAASAEDLTRLGRDGVLRARVWALIDFPSIMSHDGDTEFFDTAADAVYGALTRAHPTLSRGEFDDMPIGMIEMFNAIGIIANQTGMMREVKPSAAGPLASEGSNQSPRSQTGTP